MITKVERRIHLYIKMYPHFESYLSIVNNYVKNRKKIGIEMTVLSICHN